MAASTQSSRPVFVFGSCLDGKHTSESAAIAMRFFHARAGDWSGPTGHAYVIPYLATDGTVLPLNVIKNYVTPFIKYAERHSELRFQIARFGCGPCNHSDDDMAALFSKTPENCSLPGLWASFYDRKQPARLLVFDPSAQSNQERWRKQFQQYLALNAPLWNVSGVEVVSVGNARAIVANDNVAKHLELKHRVFGPDTASFGDDAAFAAEYQAVWYATRVLSVADFDQTAHPEQMRIMRSAARAGLLVDQLDVNAA